MGRKVETAIQTPQISPFSQCDARMPGRFPPGTVIHYDAQAMHSAQAPQESEKVEVAVADFFGRGLWEKTTNYLT